MKHPFIGFIATFTVMLCLIGTAHAQENLPFGPSNYEQDFQIFAPFDLDLDNMADTQWSGYFFEYNKLFWSYTGERTTIGHPDVVQFSEIIYYNNPQDEGDPPPPYQLHNTLTNVPPRSGFALGNRYEFGYQDQGHGWKIGVLDGPDQDQTKFYGFARRADGGLPPFIDPDYTGSSDIGPGPGGATVAAGNLRAFGFGSVPVLFATPPGFLQGFRDYMNFGVEEIGTQGGPILYVGNYSASSEDPNPPFPVFRLADDLDGDGVAGSTAFVTIKVINNIPTAVFGIMHNFNDLHEFNVFFNSVQVHNHTETNGVEAMWTHQLTNNHYMAKHQNNRLIVGWGARFLQLDDRFRVDADGSILGRTVWDTTFTNNIVGPQVGISWENQRQRWRLTTDARFLFGYNAANWSQEGLMGEELIPGALNRTLYGRPTAFAHGLKENEFSPVGELRVQASYHITSAFALKLGYTGSYIGNIKRAAQSVEYRLPDFGYRDAGTQDMLTNGFDLGAEFVY